MSASTIEINLESAGKNYGACARKVEIGVATPMAPTARELELLIGFGIASDWARRSGALRPLMYSKRIMNKSNKTPGLTEMIRFTMAWAGLNALFARPEILKLLGTKTKGSELELFNVLLKNCGLLPAKVAAYEGTLQSILAEPVSSRVPGHPAGTILPTAQVLHEKFTPMPYRAKGVGIKIQKAIATGSMGSLDLATIIYAMRNWTVHGGLLGSSFRGVSKFNRFIGTVLEATASIHLGLSGEFLRKL